MKDVQATLRKKKYFCSEAIKPLGEISVLGQIFPKQGDILRWAGVEGYEDFVSEEDNTINAEASEVSENIVINPSTEEVAEPCQDLPDARSQSTSELDTEALQDEAGESEEQKSSALETTPEANESRFRRLCFEFRKRGNREQYVGIIQYYLTLSKDIRAEIASKIQDLEGIYALSRVLEGRS
jgi:hypothetical protein